MNPIKLHKRIMEGLEVSLSEDILMPKKESSSKALYIVKKFSKKGNEELEFETFEDMIKGVSELQNFLSEDGTRLDIRMNPKGHIMNDSVCEAKKEYVRSHVEDVPEDDTLEGDFIMDFIYSGEDETVRYTPIEAAMKHFVYLTSNGLDVKFEEKRYSIYAYIHYTGERQFQILKNFVAWELGISDIPQHPCPKKWEAEVLEQIATGKLTTF